MNGSGRFDIFAALLAKNATPAGNGQQKNAGLQEAGDAKAAGNNFGEIFAGADKRSAQGGAFSLQRGEYVKTPPVAEARPDAGASPAPGATPDGKALSTIKTAPREAETIETIKPSAPPARPDHAGERGDRAIFVEESIAAQGSTLNDVLPEKRAVNDLFTGGFLVNLSGNGNRFAEATERAELFAFAVETPGSLSTVKLQNAPIGDVLAPTLQTAPATPSAERQRIAAEAYIVNTATAGRSIALDDGSSFLTVPVDVVTRAQNSFSEVNVPPDRILEFRQAAPTSVNHANPAPNLHTIPFGLAAVSASPLPIGLGDGLTLFDADLSYHPSASIQPAAPHHAGGAAIIAAPNAQAFVNMTGVLPQIQAAVSARNGRDFVEVRLDPPELGRIRIDFNVEGAETIKAVIGAERAETLDHLKRNIADLEQQLKQAGFGSVSFEFLAGGERNFAQERADGLFAAFENGAEVHPSASNTVYLSLRENAQLDLLV